MENIKDKVWKTRKSRINAESRLLFIDLFLKIMIPYYSVAFLCFQISPNFLNFQSNSLNWTATSCSILIVIFSILISAEDYRYKARRMKKCYLELRRLEMEKSTEGMEEKYINILEKYDNHLQIDYYKLYILKKIKSYNHCDEISFTEKGSECFFRHCKILFFYITSFFAIGTIVIFPLLAFLYYVAPKLSV